MNNEENLIEYSFYADREIREHSHRDVEIIFALEGTLHQKVENDLFEMREGDFVVINTGRRHSSFADGDYMAASFHINYQMLSSMMQTGEILFWCNTVKEKSDAHEEIRKLLNQILKQYFTRDQVQTKVFLQGLYYQLIYQLTMNFTAYSDEKSGGPHSKKTEVRMGEIEAYIQANYQRSFTLNEMAEQMHLSPGYLSKYILKNKGVRFTDYVSSIRLFHAVEDLLYTDRSVTRIIFDNGFPNVASFNKLFQNTYRMTPSAYRVQKKAAVKESHPGGEETNLSDSRIQNYLEHYNLEQEPESEKTSLTLSACLGENRIYTDKSEQVINIGRMEDLLDARMQEHVLVLCRELGFTHVRFWNVFQADMLYQINEDAVSYNFIRIDEALDFLVENKIRVYLSFEDKPKKTVHDPENQIYFDSENEMFDLSSQKYREDEKSFFSLIYQFAEHLINRYGIYEIEQWFFELWWPFDDNAKISEVYTDMDYFKMFNIINQTFKQFSEKIRVGGFSIFLEGNMERLERILRLWREQGDGPDFLSIHCFPYTVRIEGGRTGIANSTDENHIYHQIVQLRKLLKNIGMEECPIHVTEWGNTLSNRSAINDSCFKGAFIMKILLACQEETQVMAYRYGSDLYGVAADNDAVIFGDNGLLTVGACRKPAFYGMLFVNSLYRNRLIQSEQAAITSDGKNNYRIACHNCQHYGYKFYLQNEDEQDEMSLNELFEDYEEITVQFQIRNVANGLYRVRTQCINLTNGSIQDEIHHMGGVNEMGLSEIKYLQKICIPHLQVASIYVENGVLRFVSTLQPNEIQLIDLDYQHSK